MANLRCALSAIMALDLSVFLLLMVGISSPIRLPHTHAIRYCKSVTVRPQFLSIAVMNRRTFSLR